MYRGIKIVENVERLITIVNEVQKTSTQQTEEMPARVLDAMKDQIKIVI